MQIDSFCSSFRYIGAILGMKDGLFVDKECGSNDNQDTGRISPLLKKKSRKTLNTPEEKMNRHPSRLFCYKGRTRNYLVGCCLEIHVMQDLA